MKKAEARKIFLEKRKSISAIEKAKWDDLLLIQFQKLRLPQLHSVFAYAAMDKFAEINTDAFLSFLEFQHPGIQIAYPVCDFETNTMKAVLINDKTTFVINKYHTAEPEGEEILHIENIDLVIVPLVSFDTKGFRVGYGKGFYDKYMALMRPECIKVGLSYFEPVEQFEDTNKFDVPLDYCVTPERIYEF